MNTPSNQPFGVYVHWPFCAAKCPYCDFNSHVRHQGVDQFEFVKAYDREIRHMAELSGPRSVTSIFFGGGTPSLMEAGSVEAIIDSIAAHWSLSRDIEITLEANPTSVEAGRFRDYRTAGVNRLSLGIQSLDDRELHMLGRQHSSDEAIHAIKIAQNVFPRMSFDLIYARPGQTAKSWEDELSRAIELCAGHLSLYQLTFEKGTRFFDLREAGKLVPLHEDPSAELYEITQSITGKHGLHSYEISNHAVSGEECRHNLVYWRGQDYAGVGPGAHGRLQTMSGRLATATLRHPETWFENVMANGHGLEDRSELSSAEIAEEFLMMGLRLAEGFDPNRYEALKGSKINAEKLDDLTQLGFLETLGDGNLRASQKGFLVLDSIIGELAAGKP